MSLKNGNNPNLTVTEALRLKKNRENTYREKALKLYPWICGHCGREFEGKKLKELTVHHKNHDHDYNPEDGSNWELLCIYCHDNEHQRHTEELLNKGIALDGEKAPSATFNPFADLKSMMSDKDNEK